MEGERAVIDKRLTDKSQDTLVSAFRSISVKDDEIPLRPDFGKSGTAIMLRTNFFTVDGPHRPLHEYDVSVTPAG